MTGIEMKLNIPVHYQISILRKLYFFRKKKTSKKREITQIKSWIELSSLVNRTGSTLSTSVLSFKLIALIVIEKF
jgi:macrodomain Ter protein organizer (MatP/YcbG family)